jgi:hypothetical protein
MALCLSKKLKHIKGEIKMTNQTQNNVQVTQDGTQTPTLAPDQVLNQVVGLVEQLLKSLTQAAGGQGGNQLLTQMMPMLEKLLTQLTQNPTPQNEDNMPGNDNKFMEIDDIVDNLVNAGMITASNFTVNVELFRESPITVSTTNADGTVTDVKKVINAGKSITEEIEAEENEGNVAAQPKEAR